MQRRVGGAVKKQRKDFLFMSEQSRWLKRSNKSHVSHAKLITERHTSRQNKYSSWWMPPRTPQDRRICFDDWNRVDVIIRHCAATLGINCGAWMQRWDWIRFCLRTEDVLIIYHHLFFFFIKAFERTSVHERSPTNCKEKREVENYRDIT